MHVTSLCGCWSSVYLPGVVAVNYSSLCKGYTRCVCLCKCVCVWASGQADVITFTKCQCHNAYRCMYVRACFSVTGFNADSVQCHPVLPPGSL